MPSASNEAEYVLESPGFSDLSGRLPLVKTPTVIGRASEADIRLLGPAISRRHCEFIRDPVSRRWWVRDLRSHNGTRVNGQPVRERLLHSGDVVQVGDTDFTLRAMHDAPTDAITPIDDRTIAAEPPEGDSYTTSLREVRPPALSATHLESLMALHRRLLDIESRVERMTELCRMLAGEEFHGRAAVVLRVDGGDDAPAIRQLSTPQSAAGESETTPYYSMTLLRAVRERREPTMASWSDQSPGALAVTRVDHMRQRAAMACPLEWDDRSMTVLYIVAPAPYARGEWLALADLAAEQFRQADRAWNARRLEAENAAFQRELELARTMQLQFIPLQADAPGLELAIGYQPCRWVGGDYLDVLTPGPDRVVLVVADVCGKGVQAALLTASLHTMVHSALDSGMDLVTLIQTLNQYLCATLTRGGFVTLQCIEIDVQTGVATCVNAGHPPALVIGAGQDPSASGVRRMLAAANLPLGVQPMVPESRVDELRPGELLIMYTDGLTEMADESGRMLGVTGLGEMARDAAGEAADGAILNIRQALLDRIETLRDDRMALDDQTFMLARRSPKGSSKPNGEMP